eukprot:TRINITY_DN15846_c0_g2_i1.p1 TRINITY_DN15846_c0_g2~~TRINITY_DN15846_c0_g2_i1.p1  ORF type:complete len:245 (-),score=32.76 TRINITY_DN15846_c0_g2_i1:249-983(-)
MEAAFKRGTSNVGWCEFVVQPHAYHPEVGEFWNTSTSIVFYCFAGLFGLWQAVRNGYSSTHAFCDVMLVLVGLGSGLFHGTQSYAGELLDELPMSVMALGYMFRVNGSHWLTSEPYRGFTFGAAIATVCLAWTAYFWLHNFEIFQACFAFQIALPGFISLFSGPEPIFSASKRLWWIFLGGVLFGKFGWDYERFLNARSRCPTSEMDPRFWLHANWHFWSALAHRAWLSYMANLEAAAEKRKVT